MMGRFVFLIFVFLIFHCIIPNEVSHGDPGMLPGHQMRSPGNPMRSPWGLMWSPGGSMISLGDSRKSFGDPKRSHGNPKKFSRDILRSLWGPMRSLGGPMRLLWLKQGAFEKDLDWKKWKWPVLLFTYAISEQIGLETWGWAWIEDNLS